MPITAAEFDRLAEDGKEGPYDKYFEPITEAELLREVEKSRRGGRKS